jgi:hypothetical protein
VNKNTKSIYVDENVIQLVESVSEQMQTNDVSALNSAWDDTEYENPGGAGQDEFNMLDMNKFRIHCSTDEEYTSNKKTDSSVLEQYIAQRDADIKLFDPSSKNISMR